MSTSDDTDMCDSPSSTGRQPTVNIGIIGEVAHGKTALVEALTGVDTRRHKKEIQSNRTLRLGYANINITKCSCDNEIQYISGETDCSCHSVLASIVDCPGHQVLLTTMISGAHIMDTYIVVVAANTPCPQKQTQEHVDITQIIGRCKSMLVAQNKIDLVKEEPIRESHKQILKFFNDCEIHDAPVIPVSAQKSVNVSHILKCMYDYVKEYDDLRKQSKDDISEPYGIVVRSFDVNKPGAEHVQGLILGGSVAQGAFRLGQRIIMLPQKLKSRIITLKSDTTYLTEARSGGLIALQTDLNPVYCNSLIGSTFILEDDYRTRKVPDERFGSLIFNQLSPVLNC